MVIDGTAPLVRDWLRIDLRWHTDLDVQNNDFFNGPPFSLNSVPVERMKVKRDFGDTHIAFWTRRVELVEAQLENFEYAVRKIIARTVGGGTAAQETDSVHVSGYVNAPGPAPNPPEQLQSTQAVVHVQQEGYDHPEAIEVEQNVRDETGERVDVARALAGYNIYFKDRFISWSDGVTAKLAVNELSGDDATLVFYAGSNDAPEPTVTETTR